jgi:hypothetical protein
MTRYAEEQAFSDHATQCLLFHKTLEDYLRYFVVVESEELRIVFYEQSIRMITFVAFVRNRCVFSRVISVQTC